MALPTSIEVNPAEAEVKVAEPDVIAPSAKVTALPFAPYSLGVACLLLPAAIWVAKAGRQLRIEWQGIGG
jgi:hypothetical protein